MLNTSEVDLVDLTIALILNFCLQFLEEIAIHSANHYCKERAVLRADGTNDVFAEVLAAIGHGGLTAGLHSAVTGARIAFKARLSQIHSVQFVSALLSSYWQIGVQTTIVRTTN